jgi:Cu/Ag efflux protein CusF
VLTAASASSITVKTTTGDVVVAVTTSTLIRMQGKVVSASVLVAGSRVEVEAVRKADHTLAAVSITVESPSSLAEIEGSVTAVGTDNLTVHTKSGDDITISVNADTIIRADDHRLGLSDVKAGDHVNVDARVNADGSFTALRIEVQNEHGDENGNGNHTVELTGLIASVSSGSISVTAGGKTVEVKISSITLIRHGSTTLSLTDLKVGNRVEVKGQLNAGGSIAATLIQVEDAANDDHHESVEVDGTITAVSATSLTVNAEGHSVTMALTSSTVVKNGDHAGSLSDLKTGQRVEVHADRKTDGSLVATQVKIDH